MGAARCRSGVIIGAVLNRRRQVDQSRVDAVLAAALAIGGVLSLGLVPVSTPVQSELLPACFERWSVWRLTGGMALDET